MVLGGPIAKDRLWYYAAYNPTRKQEDYEVPGWGVFNEWTTTHNFAGKLTWRANERNTLTLSAVGDPSTGRPVWGASVPPLNMDPLLYTSRNGNLNFMLSGRHLVHDHLLI